MEEGREKRTLTESDVKAIVDELECRITKRFYFNLGRGVFAIVWKAIVTCMAILAVYGIAKGGKLW